MLGHLNENGVLIISIYGEGTGCWEYFKENKGLKALAFTTVTTNEELETSKEELQSLNEESATVNAELQSRIDELSKTNDDMKNLLNSTDIATLFLDSKLCIKRYTDQVKSIIRVIDTDVGRSLRDLTSRLLDLNDGNIRINV